MKKPNVLIVIEDGVLQNVYADADIHVAVIDHDDQADEPVIVKDPYEVSFMRTDDIAAEVLSYQQP